jgi:hypothetical protein
LSFFVLAWVMVVPLRLEVAVYSATSSASAGKAGSAFEGIDRLVADACPGSVSARLGWVLAF